jgi:Starch-binding module 26/Chitobiase/beta-hexosaminidase C-terminal domain/Glycosyl hydrolase family 57/Secretion system C-terminal sorting domain
MKRTILCASLLLMMQAKAQVQTTYLWHLHQPTYWGDKSLSNPNRSQLLKESQNLKLSGQNNDANGLAHPLNNLEEIFSLPDRVSAYQFKTKNAVSSISQYPKAGAQITYGGSLLESINSLATTGQWGYQPNWASNIITAKSWMTSGGKPRMDVVNFTMHHSLSPLISDEVLKKEIQAFKFYAAQTFGSQTSKGYWPAECAFSERIIKTLVEEGIEWSVVANSHLARTLSDYPLVFGTNGCNIDPPNKADKLSTNGTNWHSGQIDGRGGQFAAPYCFTPHKAKYVDPNTGNEYKIDVIPMADLDSYRDGYSQQGIGNLQTNIAPFSPTSRPSLMLLAHDGDNAWGGGSSYYDEAVSGYTGQAASAGYTPTTIQQYLSDYPVPASDVVHVEDGSWFNAANDWGSPQFINWLWPMYTTPDYEFNPNGWTEDIRNQAVMIAAENHCIMAEQLEGSVQIADIVNPTASASPAEKAWHFLMPGLDSGNAYYGDALDLEIKATVAANNAINFAQSTIAANAGVDNTKPSVFIPQRYPYNPGEIGFGPNYAYKQKLNSADFTVWTLAYDVNGIQNATLKYRIDNNGSNPLTSNQNETYTGGTEVGNWVDLPMTLRVFPKENVTNNPNINLYILPTKIADQYAAKITGISEKLVDYYIEVTDKKGNVTKTAIQHTWVGTNLNINPILSFNGPDFSATATTITINATDSTDPSPKIYYTTDGSTPTLLSNNAISTTTINVTQTTTIKAFAADKEGNQSAIASKTITIGEIPSFTVHFKAPAIWTSPRIHYWDALPAGTLSPTTWPGVAMTAECDGWFRYTFTGISSTKLIFNNGTGGAGNQTLDLTANANGWYNFATSSWIPEPANFNTPCLSITPVGGTFNAGTNLNVVLTAKDNSDPNPVIYYTLDGSTPTTTSAATTGTLTIPIAATKTLKAFARDNTGVNSTIRTETYSFNAVKTFTVYFKSPATWTTRKIYYWNALPTNSLANATWPGVNMTAHTQGWYKYTFTGVDSINMIFNNGNSGVGTNQTANIVGVSNEIWYDWTSGIIPAPIQDPLAITENSLDEKIDLFPNPTHDIIAINSKLVFDEISIYATTGALLKNYKLKDKTIDMSDFAAGIYIFKLITNDHKLVYKQIVKE